MHTAHAGNKRPEDAQAGYEPSEDDGLPPVTGEEALCLREALGGDQHVTPQRKMNGRPPLRPTQ